MNPSPSPLPQARLILSLICFFAGAAIMIIEISANRLLAPLFGNTSYTWTALIGVILIAFSVGGYLGGWLAEKKADFALLGWLLASAAVLTMFVPAVFVYAGPANAGLGHISGPLAISLILFALPGVLLGAISPASVRLYSLLGKDAHVGTAAGMINTVGNMGNAFQPVIGAMIFNAVGWDWLFTVYACAFVAAASMWLIIDPRRTFYAREKGDGLP